MIYQTRLRYITRAPIKATVFTTPRAGIHTPFPFRAQFVQRRYKSVFSPSDEQRKIASLCSDQNVLVSARPGSGKTATVEEILSAHPDKRIGTLLYSKQLQTETARRLVLYPNGDVFTFHGMAGKLLGVIVFNDAELRRHRARIEGTRTAPVWDHEPYDIVVLDEFQDCTPVLFWLACQFIAANNEKLKLRGLPPARLVILGDERQCIYSFRGANQQYLGSAPKLLAPLTAYPFTKVSLHRSFRLPKPSVRFVSDVFLGGQELIVSEKDGPKPLFVRCPSDENKARAELVQRLASLIHQHGPENTAILAPSIRSYFNPLRKIVNMLKREHGFPMDVSLGDDTPLDDRVIKNKLCVSSIHQFKGRERDLVIVFDIDASYFRFPGRDLPQDQCPNVVFVAITRAMKQLVIVHKEPAKLMPFMSVDALYKTADVININGKKKLPKLSAAPAGPVQLGLKLPKTVGVLHAIRHVPDVTLEDIVSRECSVRELSPALPPAEHNALRSAVLAGPKAGMYEVTSDINGMVIAAAFEHQATGQLRSLGCDNVTLDGAPPQGSRQYIAWLSRRACDYEGMQSGYIVRPVQMKDHKFNWIRPEQLSVAVSRIQHAIDDATDSLRFEHVLKGVIKIDNEEVEVSGRADVVSITSRANASGGMEECLDTLWEIKQVQALSNQHIVQVCAYAYLIAAKHGKVPRILLFNARDNQTLQIVPRDGVDGLERMLAGVLRAKYTATAEQDTSDLVKQCLDVTEELSKYN